MKNANYLPRNKKQNMYIHIVFSILFACCFNEVKSQCSITATTTTTPSCYSYSNGTFTITPYGGTGYYYFSGPSTFYFDSTYTQTGVPVGTYAYTITDTAGCSFSDSITIFPANTLTGATITTNIVHESCPLVNDGAINIAVTGSGTYTTYLFNTYATTPQAFYAPGSYTFEVMDVFTTQCTSFVATVNPGSMANCGTISGTVFFDDNANCTLDGVDFGIANYPYLFLNPGNITVNVDANGQFTRNLPLGTYTLKDTIDMYTPYTDCACPDFTFTLSTPAQLITHDAGNSFSNNTCGLSISASQISGCGEFCMASYAIAASGGTMPYIYAAGNDTVYGACSGYNYVTVYSAGGSCYDTYALYIDTASLVGATVSPTIVPSTCDVYNPDGSITLSVAGPDTPYSFIWNTTNTSSTYTNLASGNYVAYVSGNSGACSAYTYNVPLNPGTACPGFSGKVYYDVNNNCIFDTGDFPASYYPVVWDSVYYSTYAGVAYTDSLGNYRAYAPFGSFHILTDFNLAPYYYGSYHLDTNCTGHYDITTSITAPVITNLDFPLQDDDYCGTGITYTLTPECAQNGYMLKITNDSNAVIHVLDHFPDYFWYAYGFWNQAVFPPDSTIHLLIDSYYSGCNEYLTITTGPAFTFNDSLVSFTVTDEHCGFAYDGSITITDLNGLNFMYEWSNGDTAQHITGLAAGNYQLSITDGTNSCFDSTLTVGLDDSLCSKLVGKVFFDLNSNCTYEAALDDTNFSNCYLGPITINGSHTVYPDSLGNFNFACIPGTYNVHFGNTFCGDSVSAYTFSDPCTHSVIVTVDTITTVSDTAFFPLNALSSPNVEVTCFTGTAVPGFLNEFEIYLNNNSNPTGGTLFCVLDDSVTFVSAVPTFDYASGDTLFWNILNVSYGSTNFISIQSTVMPSVTLLGSLVTHACGFISSVAEPDTANNYCSSGTEVVGSFDPNDKAVSPSGIGSNGYITSAQNELTYRIRFQNTGTAPAHDVVVVDTLSSNLNLSTLQVIETSHPYTMGLNGSVLTFTFHDIMLPDSTSNEPGSHGHILYRIELNDSLAEFTPTTNTAYIYFDFNPAIVTNTVTNTINNSLTVNESTSPAVENPFHVFPNPFTNQLNIVNRVNGFYTATLMDIAGKIILQKNNLLNTTALELADMQTGVYLLRINDSVNSFTFRLVKQ